MKNGKIRKSDARNILRLTKINAVVAIFLLLLSSLLVMPAMSNETYDSDGGNEPVLENYSCEIQKYVSAPGQSWGNHATITLDNYVYFLLSIANTGDVDIPVLSILDYLPESFVYREDATIIPDSISDKYICWYVYNFSAGTNFTIEFSAAPTVFGNFTNVAQFNIFDNETYITGNDAASVTVYEEPTNSFTFNFYTGWNLITIPLENNFTASTLSAQITGCTMITKWNIYNQEYENYIVNFSGPEDDFLIEDGIGYYICVNTNSNFTVAGDPFDIVSVLIAEGYNFLGWTEDYSITASTIMDEFNCVSVSIFNPITQLLIIYDHPDDDDFLVEKGMGYIIKIEYGEHFFLYSGWNLITIPVQNNLTASSLAEMIPTCQLISHFDTKQQTYITYVVGESSPNFPIENGVGYFVLVSKNAVFTIDGNPIEDVYVPLVSGDNLLGWYQDQNTQASIVFNSVSGCNEVSIYDAENQEYKRYNSPDDEDFLIEKGMGYWISIDEENLVIVYPKDDASVNKYHPNTNYGSDLDLIVRNDYGYDPGWECDSLIKFDLSDYSDFNSIESAELFLYYYKYKDNSPSGHSLDLYLLNDDWNEYSLTWNSKPANDNISSATSIVPSSTGKWMIFDVTNDVQNIVNGQLTNNGWILKDNNYWGHFNIPIVFYKSKEAGQFLPYLKIKARNDNTPPVTTCNIAGQMGDDDWFISNVTIKLTVKDDLSGVAVLHLRLDDGLWQILKNTTSYSMTYFEQGIHKIDYYSIDNAGNVEDIKSMTFKIDNQPPITNCKIKNIGVSPGQYPGGVLIELHSMDKVSGVKDIFYKIDAQEFSLYTEPIAFTEPGTHVIVFYSLDNAGNKEGFKKEFFEIMNKDVFVPKLKFGSIGI